MWISERFAWACDILVVISPLTSHQGCPSKITTLCFITNLPKLRNNPLSVKGRHVYSPETRDRYTIISICVGGGQPWHLIPQILEGKKFGILKMRKSTKYFWFWCSHGCDYEFFYFLRCNHVHLGKRQTFRRITSIISSRFNVNWARRQQKQANSQSTSNLTPIWRYMIWVTASVVDQISK